MAEDEIQMRVSALLLRAGIARAAAAKEDGASILPDVTEVPETRPID
jgi:hypothetical protein